MGGYEERITVVHWSRSEQRAEEGFVLEGHDGTITALDLFKNEYLMSAAEDSKICVWKLHPPALYHTFKYKDPVKSCTYLCIHPSGKILLSLHSGGHLLMWNLVTGHFEFQRAVDASASKVGFVFEGECYYLLTKSGVEVYSVKSDEVVERLADEKEILDVCSVGKCIYGVTDNQRLIKWTINEEGKSKKGPRVEEDLWEGRAKCVEGCKDGNTDYVAVVTSQGEVVGVRVGKEAEVVFEAKLKDRAMCLGISLTNLKHKSKKADGA